MTCLLERKSIYGQAVTHLQVFQGREELELPER